MFTFTSIAFFVSYSIQEAELRFPQLHRTFFLTRILVHAMDCKTIFENLAGDFKATLNKIGLEDLKNAVPDISADTLKSLIQSIKERAEHLNAEDINNLWETAKELCRNNPIQATILVLQVLILACPLLLTAPFLALLGFTGVGPLAGKHIHHTSLLPHASC